MRGGGRGAAQDQPVQLVHQALLGSEPVPQGGVHVVRVQGQRRDMFTGELFCVNLNDLGKLLSKTSLLAAVMFYFGALFLLFDTSFS